MTSATVERREEEEEDVLFGDLIIEQESKEDREMGVNNYLCMT